jgi:hypothetical protein
MSDNALAQKERQNNTDVDLDDENLGYLREML